MSAIVCGVLTAAFWFLHPAAADPTAVRDEMYWRAVQSPTYRAVNALFIVILLLNAAALSGIHRSVQDRLGRVGWLGYVAASLGLMLFVGAGVFQAFVAPELVAPATRSVLSPEGPLLAGALGRVFAGTGLTFAAGYVMFALSAFRTGVFAPWSVLLLLSAVVLGLSPLMPLPVRIVGCLAYGVAHVSLGWQIVQKSGIVP